jgi:hypothetical protein
MLNNILPNFDSLLEYLPISLFGKFLTIINSSVILHKIL